MNRTEIDAFIKKNIGTITLIGGLLGMIPLLLMFASSMYGSFGNVQLWFSIAKPFVSFEFYSLDYIGDFYSIYSLGYLYFPIIFYGIMLAGYFSLKNGSATAYRLIRFSFAVIFISQLIGILWMILNFFDGDYYFSMSIYWILTVISQIVWAYIAFTILRSNIKPVDEFSTVSVEVEVSYIEATKGQRFLHHLIDSILYLGLCTSIVAFFGDSFIQELYYNGWSSLTYFVIAIIARLLYYPMFETLFGATPGKFLTGSKVVKNDGSQLKLGDTFSRTFSRMVPFEPFSFLGNNAGWHDKWTKTKVVIDDESTSIGSADDVIDDF
ncbi:MAG: hypothetical protein GQ574_18470 [Crocinitomix sp.]|nr:hypothetical protein [Crocinitomix sp.]